MNSLLLIASLSLGLATSSTVPVWPEGRAEEMNVTFGFRGDFTANKGDFPVLKMAASSIYRVFVNGKFAAYGPARGPKGMFREDEIDLSPFLRDGKNAVAIEVSAYNVGTYYIAEYPGFLMADVRIGERTVLSTPDGFKAVELPRVRKCSRYSFQRGFAEAYSLGRDAYEWRTGEVKNALPLEPRPAVKTLRRRAPHPKYEITPLVRTASTKVKYDTECKVHFDRTITFPGHEPTFKGFRLEDLDVNVQEIAQRSKIVKSEPAADVPEIALAAGDGAMFDAGKLRAGFVRMKVRVSSPGRLCFVFDEILAADGSIDPVRMTICSGFVYDFKEPGEYAIENLEPNALRWLHVFALSGEMTLGERSFRNYRSPMADDFKFDCSDPELRKIFDAARESFAENAVDVFSDCPGRERSGWICDSFFTARVSYLLTGSNVLEDLFLENYMLPEKFDIDEGMVPMCYPADHANGNFIPNFAMWFIIQVDDYARNRGGDRRIVNGLRNRLVGVVNYLAKFRNSDGLLEKLPRWVFVEWSRANDLVQDVNYPSNMCWAEALDAMDRLYGMPELAAEAARVRKVIREQAMIGNWFCDNAVRQKDGKLRLTGERTETCQYFAFFFKTATQETDPVLWKRLVEDFGPDRAKTGKWKDVWPANSLPGNYLRLELLSRAGFGDQVVKEIRGYFSKMADITGTLWEHDDTRASCCHGFASYISVLLNRHATGK